MALAAAALLVAAGCAVDLGTLGGRYSQAHDINERGVTVGWSTTADGAVHAFRKPHGRPMQDLNGAYVESRAIAVNDAGLVVGIGRMADDESHVVVWDRRGRARDLGPGYPADVNDDGTIVGARGSEQVTWDAATGAVEPLPAPPVPPELVTFVEANGINDRGDIVGEVLYDGVVRQGVLWQAGTLDPVLLPHAKPQGPLGRTWSVPVDIGNDGTIVGWSNSGAYYAVLWRAGSHEPLDITPPGSTSAEAVAVNARGEVVGSATGADRSWAFRWDPTTGVAEDLGGLGGTAAAAGAINDAGVAAGWATTADEVPPGESPGYHAVTFPAAER